MKYLITILLLGCLAFPVLSQTITIRDESDYQPLEGVLLSDDRNNMAFTSTEGEVDISKFQSSRVIRVNSTGYMEVVTNYRALVLKKGVLLMSRDELSLDEVVISANRWEQNKAEVPNKIVSVNRKDVLLQHPQTSADLLGFSNQVFVQKSQLGGGSPMIRGFSTNRLLITVDGVRMNTAIFRGGNLQNVISIDPLAIERSEVIFGPGSVIYGSDAIGGVMSFYSLDPTFSSSKKTVVRGSALSRYSSANNERTGHFDVRLGWKKWASVTSVSYSDFGDMRMGSNGPDDYLVPVYVSRVDSQDVVIDNPDPRVQTPSGYDQLSIMQKLRFRPTVNWEFDYTFHYSSTSDYARFDRHRRVRNGRPRYGEWYYGPQDWMMSKIGFRHKSKRGIYDQFSFNAARQNFKESRHSRDFGDSLRQNYFEEVDAYSVNLDFQKGDEDPHRVFYGLEAIFNEVSSRGVETDIYSDASSSLVSRYPDGATWSSYATYVSYEYVPNEQWAVQAGARYNAFSINAEFDEALFNFPFQNANLSSGALTGSLGTVYSPGPTWKIRANLSTGFRAPNVDDVGKLFESVDGSIVVPNPGLSAEYAYNAELGIAKVFGKVLKLDATAYYTLLEDAQVRRPFTINGQDSIVYNGELSEVLAIQNAAQARVYGVQLGFTLRMPAGFALESNYNIQQGEEELNDGSTAPMRHVAPGFGTTRLSFTSSRIRLELYSNYNERIDFEDLAPSEQAKEELYAADDNGNPYSPSWYTINFKGSYKINSHFQVSCGLENITDQRYLPYSSGLAAPGRNFILALNASF